MVTLADPTAAHLGRATGKPQLRVSEAIEGGVGKPIQHGRRTRLWPVVSKVWCGRRKPQPRAPESEPGWEASGLVRAEPSISIQGCIMTGYTMVGLIGLATFGAVCFLLGAWVG